LFIELFLHFCSFSLSLKRIAQVVGIYGLVSDGRIIFFYPRRIILSDSYSLSNKVLDINLSIDEGRIGCPK